MEEKPIFVVGAPRSGTTLLRNMLNRHPAIAICRETEFRHYIYRRRQFFGPLSDLDNRARLIRNYLALERIRRTGLDLTALKNHLLEHATDYPSLFAALLRFYMRANGKQRWGEKTPDHALFTETLFDWFPGATVIHIIRDPRDVVASLIQMPSFPNSAIGNAHLWKTFNGQAARSAHRLGYVAVQYERLVLNPESELRTICEAAGEQFSPVMLESNWDPTADRPWFQRAEQRVTAERIGAWRTILTQRQASMVEWYIGSKMEESGYSREVQGLTLSQLAREFGFGVFDAIRRRVGEFPGVLYSHPRFLSIELEERAKTRYHDRVLRSRSSVGQGEASHPLRCVKRS